MTIYHWHHIVPKHAGGTDDPSNLVRLTIEEHAEAHKKLYEQYGREQDLWAWQGLSGQIGKDEIIYKSWRKGSQTKISCKYCSRKISEHNMSRHLYSCTNGKEGVKANNTRKGMKLDTSNWKGTLKSITNGKKDRRIKHDDPIPEGWYEGSCRKGTKYNRKSMEPKICITDGISTKKIPKSDPIPDGWKPGRHYTPT